MTWQNWAGTATADPARRYWPRTADAIADAVRDAAAGGLTVRALGSGHSFTPAAATAGAAIDLSNWTGIVSVDRGEGAGLPGKIADPGGTGGAAREVGASGGHRGERGGASPDDGCMVTVRSGTTLRELTAELDALGLAMPNMGDIDAQTISGAISTGTHGTGARLGGIATQAEALELVTADGSIVRASAADAPELLAAARVSIGALGVISTVTLRCVPAFRLTADERPMPLGEVLDRFDEFASGNDHFEFFWFPYGRNALVKRNNRIVVRDKGDDRDDSPRPLPEWRRIWEYEVMENAVFGALCAAGRAVPSLGKPIGQLVAATLSARSYSADSHRVFVTPRRVRFVESEYAVPRQAVLDVLTALRGAIAGLSQPVMFPVEVRVAAADDIWMSTAYGRDTAYIAIHQYIGVPYQEYFAAFESIAASVGGRPHWGKMHTLDAARLAGLYPKFGDFLRIRDKVDPDRRFANPYLDQVLGR